MTSFDMSTGGKAVWKALPLDPDLYWILDTERDFFQAHTSIQSDSALEQHILEVQKLAYSVVPYPCIRLFSFLRLNIARRDTYQKALILANLRPGAIFLDVGAGFGTDVRKLTSDSYPVENVVATDLHEGIWNLGHRLFKSNPETFPVAFVPGDVFQLTEGLEQALSSTQRPDLSSLRSLLPLKRQVSVIYAGHFFHLFEEQRGKMLAERLALLLSVEKGSLIFGLHLGAPEPVLQTTPAGTMFCHSAETWKKMWEGVFPSGSVRIESEVVKGHQGMAKAWAGSAEEAPKIWLLVWSVERL